MPASTSKYKPEYDEQAFNLCLLGATDKELANAFHVEEQTINNWKIDHPSFFESLKAGKEDADLNVIKSLYKRAQGYTYTETVKETGVPTKVTSKEMPPDPTSMIFWLKNRQRKKWTDTKEVITTEKRLEDFDDE
jgi:hypothetical protein